MIAYQSDKLLQDLKEKKDLDRDLTDDLFTDVRSKCRR